MAIIQSRTEILKDDYITIPMEEYKELLMIKGKYEELKSNQWLNNFKNAEKPIEPYKVICEKSYY